MSYIISIDVGIKNLGICVFDFTCMKVVYWRNVSLCPSGRYCPSDNVMYVREFVQKHSSYFEHAQKVIIEKQMRPNMRIVEALLHSMFYYQALIVSPKAVKAHFGLSTRDYRLNKQRAVEWADLFLLHNAPMVAQAEVQSYRDRRKKDDLADSLVLLFFYLDTYSNQLEVTFL